MLRTILIPVVSVLPLCQAAELADPASPNLANYNLIFSDEFNGSRLHPARWHVGINSINAIQGSQHCAYREENLTVKDGHLIIEAKKEPVPVESRIYGSKKKTFAYSSGAINTDGLFHLKDEFYIEIRCQFAQNPGGFVAFWTMPAKRSFGEGMLPKDMHETDFFEFKCNPASASYYRYFSSLWWHSLNQDEAKQSKLPLQQKGENHFWITNQKHKLNTHVKMKKPLVDFSKPFTMGFKATKEKLTWHICQNGTAFNEAPYMTFEGGMMHSRIDPETKKPFQSFERPVPNFNNYLIFNYRLSMDAWTGGPVQDAFLPSTTKVDYIRVYQKL